MTPKAIKTFALLALLVITAEVLSGFNKNKLSATTPTKTLDESNLSAQDQSDQEEGKRIMKSFILAYNSYRMGETSNLISLYPVMCAKLETTEKTKEETLRENFSDYDKYVTVESQDKKTTIESYDENKIVVEVTIEKVTWNGAIVPDPAGESNKYKMIDQNGQVYSGDKDDLIEKIATETYRITGIKEASDWKVCEFQKIN
ncbi:MAG: hypothetical protein PHX30_04780 [Candidatus Pacebacteria bacterium]|jgi:hypothetical protein|nr:hypothetical protein [Candidatus Paceibacterota bacterium]